MARGGRLFDSLLPLTTTDLSFGKSAPRRFSRAITKKGFVAGLNYIITKASSIFPIFQLLRYKALEPTDTLRSIWGRPTLDRPQKSTTVPTPIYCRHVLN